MGCLGPRCPPLDLAHTASSLFSLASFPGCRTNPLTRSSCRTSFFATARPSGFVASGRPNLEGDGRERDQRVRIGLDEHVRPPDHPVANLDRAVPQADRHGHVDVRGDDGVRDRLLEQGLALRVRGEVPLDEPPSMAARPFGSLSRYATATATPPPSPARARISFARPRTPSAPSRPGSPARWRPSRSGRWSGGRPSASACPASCP